MTTREKDLLSVSEHVRELLTGFSTAERIARDPGRGLDGISRRGVERVTWRVSHRGLIEQLVAGLPKTGGTGSNDGTGVGGQSGSVQPSAARISDTLSSIDRAAQLLRREMRSGAGKPRRRVRRTLAADLLEIRALAHVASPDVVARAARETGAWVTWAKEALGLQAPWVYLRDVSCLYCHGPLKVRQDVSSDVRCARPDCRDATGSHPRWSRGSWPFMLEQISG